MTKSALEPLSPALSAEEFLSERNNFVLWFLPLSILEKDMLDVVQGDEYKEIVTRILEKRRNMRERIINCLTDLRGDLVTLLTTEITEIYKKFSCVPPGDLKKLDYSIYEAYLIVRDVVNGEDAKLFR